MAKRSTLLSAMDILLALPKIAMLCIALVLLQAEPGSGQQFRYGFTFNGFHPHDLSLDGMAEFTPDGLLRLTNDTTQKTSHAFYPHPICFKNSTDSPVVSFSTTFVFAIISRNPKIGGPGIAFVIAPQMGIPGSLPSQYLGLFNISNQGYGKNQVFAVELDTIQSKEFQDIDNNHVGIDINSLVSDPAASAGYYPDDGDGNFENLTLISGQPMQVWVDYNGTEKIITVTLAPVDAAKPSIPLLSRSLDLSPIINQTMYVGFSSSTGSLMTSHYILGWSFQGNGHVEELALSKLPGISRTGKKPTSKLLMVGVPILCFFLVSTLVSGFVYYFRRKKKYAEVLEDWELQYGTHRFKYKHLHIATRGFSDQELLGIGGFGRVYRGLLPNSNNQIAVKRISHDSKQGMREFVAEIVSLGRLRHRNLVTLLGYCRRKGELLLVYDYMPNGSLDKYLFNQPKVTLNWTQRFKVMKGVASGLLYLHDGWDQVVIHRDIKASNVLLDAAMNGRLADFGLARLYNHGSDPQSTRVVGTLGYLAPEHARSGRATKVTDVFSFGAFLLEVATGRRPIEPLENDDTILADWVYSCWSRGQILEASDPNLGGAFVAEEIELVLKLGLVCSHSEPTLRPTTQQVVQYLEGDLPLDNLTTSLGTPFGGMRLGQAEAFDAFVMSYPSSIDRAFSCSSSAAESLLSCGR